MRSSAIGFKFRKEILFILLFKIIVLSAIWYCWFRDPIEKHLTVDKVAQQLVGSHTLRG